jgi:hypothetical protein
MSATVTIGSGDVVMARNLGTRPLTLTYGGRKYDVPVEKQVAIPFDCMTLWFGDPRATDAIRSVRDEAGIVTWVPDRATEVRRLRLKWGQITGSEETVTEGPRDVPKVEFSDFDGRQIFSVVDDPFGDHISPVQITRAENDDLRALVLRQQDQIDAMAKMMKMDKDAIQVVQYEAIEEMPEDDSTTSHTTSPIAHAQPLIEDD